MYGNLAAVNIVYDPKPDGEGAVLDRDRFALVAAEVRCHLV